MLVVNPRSGRTLDAIVVGTGLAGAHEEEQQQETEGGEHVDHRGPHFTVSDVRFLPPTVQRELPIWVAALGPQATQVRAA